MWIDKSKYELMEAECKLADSQRKLLKIDGELISSFKNEVIVMSNYIKDLKEINNALKNRISILEEKIRIQKEDEE